MSNQYLVEPCLDFVEQVASLGGDSVKKCYQCATCTVACTIAPDNSPFPRKEMIATSWGLKDRVLGSADIWMCHECGDCSELCPRGAQPADVLSAARSAAITEYATPKFLGKMVNDAKMLPLFLGIPAAWFALMAFITMTMGESMEKLFKGFGMHWHHHTDAPIASADFVSSWLVDVTFVPLLNLSILIFLIGLIKFVKDIHANAVLEGKTDKTDFNLVQYLVSVVKAIPTIMLHKKFNECGENKSRALAHQMVLFGFIGCFIVTAIFFVVLYIGGVAGPYDQINPVKILANIAGVGIVVGSFLMIKDRLAKSEPSSFKDWALLVLVFGLGATGMLTQGVRLLGYIDGLVGIAQVVSYFFYYIHLILIFCLFAYLPFSKMAHIVYRVAALGYAEYANRK
ncbi:MAG: heterodisulfide reductase [Desulfobacterales bacterium]|nr:heterodisulfide reductase [Desulfobacterales bacterium]MCP4162644.1 heterodisulfide reductase [Deltaproteobacteria bacterium]